MVGVIWTFILGFILCMAVLALGRPFQYLKLCYYLGISIWSRYLPLVASIIYLIILSINISNATILGQKHFMLKSYFSYFELALMFMCAPLFFTNYSNIVAGVLTIYSIERLIFTKVLPAPNVGLMVLFCCSTIITILGDKMPWKQSGGLSPTAEKIRELSLFVISFGAIVTLAVALIKLTAFNHWANELFVFYVSHKLTLLVMFLTLLGWLSVIGGFTKYFSIPILSLPSLVALAYISKWPSYILIVPFTAALALSLSFAERRRLIR